MTVTVKEKIREMFGITFQVNSAYVTSMIDCKGMSCTDCPLENCNRDGINEWLESEYQEEAERKKGDENNQTKTKDYQKGFEDGKAQVISDLSKIFLRR